MDDRISYEVEISNEDEGCISNLRFLGVTLLKGAKAKKVQDKEKKGKKKQRDDAPPYELSRYVPQLKVHTQEAADGTLSVEEFPYVKEDPNSAESKEYANCEMKVDGSFQSLLWFHKINFHSLFAYY